MTDNNIDVELRKVALDELREQNSYELRKKELEIENRKAELQERKVPNEVESKVRVASISVLSGLVGALATLGAAYVAGAFSVKEVEVTGITNQNLAQQKFSFDLIKNALDEPDDKTRARRLRFMVDIGLLNNLNTTKLFQYADLEEQRLKTGGEGDSLLPEFSQSSNSKRESLFGKDPSISRIFTEKQNILQLEKEGLLESPMHLSAFLAYIADETGDFSVMKENANYSASRLQMIWPNRFQDKDTAVAVARRPEAILNLIYGNRGGNSEPGDGWKYRSRGFVGLWARSNYQSVGSALGIDLETEPDLAADPQIAFNIALYWLGRNERAAIERLETGDLKGFLKIMRGHDGGFKRFMVRYNDFFREIVRFRSNHPLLAAVKTTVNHNSSCINC